MNKKRIKAWYFSRGSKRLGYNDDRLIRKGRTHRIKGEPEACHQGLHGSKRIIDALQYAPGPVIWRVELSGDMDIQDDKIAAQERKYLWGFDATHILRRFARRSALDVIDLWDAPDIVVRYLKTGDESIRAAAWDAAWAAAWAAAWDAARDAAWAAAWDAARAAAWAAARDKQNRRLTSMVVSEAKQYL